MVADLRTILQNVPIETVTMKTPERWRALPRRALFVSILAKKSSKGCQDVMPWRHTMTSWRRTVTSRDVTWRQVSWQTGSVIHPSETSEITFFNLATLTFDLWPWPSNSSEILSRSTPPPNFGSVCQTVQPWERSQTDTRTHTHTDRRDRFYTLDRWRGREICTLISLL